jgi:hypothetical protein
MLVPHSPFRACNGGKGLNHPFSWCVRVREKHWEKREYTYWMNGGGELITPDMVVRWVAKMCPHVDVLRMERVRQQPTQPLFPIPPRHFQFGILQQKLDKLAALQAKEGRVTVLTEAKSMIRGFSLRDPLTRRSSLWRQGQ